MSDSHLLEKRLKKIRNSENLSKEAKDFLSGDYLKYVERSGAEKPSTQERYIRQLERILSQKGLSPSEIQEKTEEQLKQLNKEIVEDIRDSEFKKTAWRECK